MNKPTKAVREGHRMPGRKKAPKTDKRALTSQTQRRKLIADSRRLYLSLWPNGLETGACVYHAVALQLLTLKRFGLLLMLQAGSAYWRRTPDPEDEHHLFGYEWQGDTPTGKVIVLKDYELLEVMPEVHVWLAHRDPDTLIDPTTGTWPRHALRISNLTWTTRCPPEFLWDPWDRIAERHAPRAPIYQCKPEACHFVSELAERDVYPRVAKTLGLKWGGKA